MKLADEVNLLLIEDLKLSKQVKVIKSELKNKSLSDGSLLALYQIVKNLIVDFPKHRKALEPLKNSIKNRLF